MDWLIFAHKLHKVCKISSFRTCKFQSNVILCILELALHLKNQEWKNLHLLPFMYPVTMCGPSSAGHNIGPLLLSQYCPKKNVLLLLEHAVFMSEGDLTLAQITAETIIDMLSHTDYVNVIGLSTNTSIHCKEGLLKATDVNKFQLARYIHSLTRIGTIIFLSVIFLIYRYL